MELKRGDYLVLTPALDRHFKLSALKFGVPFSWYKQGIRFAEYSTDGTMCAVASNDLGTLCGGISVAVAEEARREYIEIFGDTPNYGARQDDTKG